MHAVNPFLPKAFNAADNQKELLHREQSIMRCADLIDPKDLLWWDPFF